MQDRIPQRTGTKLPPSPVHIKERVEEAPVGVRPTKSKADPSTHSQEEPWTVILGRSKGKPQKRDPPTSQDITNESTKIPVISTEHTSGKQKDDIGSLTGDKLGPTPPLINRNRPTYNQVRLSIQGETGAKKDTEKLDTNERPSQTYFREATPKGDSYAESLVKYRAPLGTLGGARRAKRTAEIEK